MINHEIESFILPVLSIVVQTKLKEITNCKVLKFFYMYLLKETLQYYNVYAILLCFLSYKVTFHDGSNVFGVFRPLISGFVLSLNIDIVVISGRLALIHLHVDKLLGQGFLDISCIQILSYYRAAENLRTLQLLV